MAKGAAQNAAPAPAAARPALRARIGPIGRLLADALMPRLGTRHTAIFCRELYMTYKAGIPLARGLEIIAGHASSIRVRRLARLMREDIRRGAGLGDSFHWRRKRFPDFTAELVKAGDAGGKLGEALRHLSEYYDDMFKLRGEILNALAYPLALIACMLIFMGPFFTQMLSYGMGERFDAQEFLDQTGLNALGLFVTVAVLWYAFSVLRQLGVLRIAWGVAGTHIWPFAPIARRFALARFFRGLAMLLEGGVNPHRSIEGAARLCCNVAIGHSLAQAAPRVRDGMPIAEALQKSLYIPSVEAGMLEVGEKSGMLNPTLRKASQYCIQEGMYGIRRWVASFEVIAIILIGFGGVPYIMAGLP